MRQPGGRSPGGTFSRAKVKGDADARERVPNIKTIVTMQMLPVK
jgi:hypothetical protein